MGPVTQHGDLMCQPNGEWTLTTAGPNNEGVFHPMSEFFKEVTPLCVVLDWLATEEGGSWEFAGSVPDLAQGLLRVIMRRKVSNGDL